MTTSKPRLPAEWEPQSAVMLTWPHGDTDWASILDEAERLYVEIASHISRHQELIIACHDGLHQRRVENLLLQASISLERIRFGIALSNDTWARDHGPLSVFTENGIRLTDFRFNGWGDKYPAELDNRITPTLASQGCFGTTTINSIDLVLEGGALECDGTGVMLATESSVISHSRNPGWSKRDIEALLSEQLGIEHFHWLKHGHLSGDDTDGHIDTLARFCDPESIIHVTAFPDDPDFPELEAMAAELAGLRSPAGRPYRLIPLPPLQPQHDAEGNRLPATYANFLIINDAVLLPIYEVPSDQAAIDTLRACFPNRTIIPIDCRTLIRQNGSLHCITMQIPARP